MSEQKNDLNPVIWEHEVSFLDRLKLRNLSPSTIAQDDKNIRSFLGFMRRKKLFELEDVDRAAFERYRDYLMGEYRMSNGRTLDVMTIQNRIFSVQRWFRFLRKKGVLAFDPIADVRAPRRKKRLPSGILSVEEIERLMRLPDLKTPRGYRDRTIMELLYSTGARSSEACEFKVEDINLEKKTAFIHAGKGGKDRFVPLTTQCCRFLGRYLAEIRPALLEGLRPAGRRYIEEAGTGGDYLFISIYGGRVRRTWLGGIMKDYLARAGLSRRIQPVHGFRHSVATHLIEGGMDVRYVQVFLGHNNINSTQIYTHVERKTLHRLIKRYHPRCLVNERVIPFVEEKQHVVA
jgi:integrase/recombinase XerD